MSRIHRTQPLADLSKDVADWDSINHVKLLIGLESDLGVRFSTDEVIGIKDVGGLVTLIQSKLN